MTSDLIIMPICCPHYFKIAFEQLMSSTLLSVNIAATFPVSTLPRERSKQETRGLGSRTGEQGPGTQ